jgi:hypothetical protein
MNPTGRVGSFRGTLKTGQRMVETTGEEKPVGPTPAHTSTAEKQKTGTGGIFLVHQVGVRNVWSGKLKLKVANAILL